MNRERVRSVVKRVAVWIPVLLLAFIFIPQGLAKFSDSSGWARAFRFWGYPDWFRVTIGVIELAGVLLMLWPRSAMIGASFIICVMLGGMGTHIVKEGGRHITSEIVPLVLATIVFVIRRRAAKTALIGLGLVAIQASGTAAQASGSPTPQALFDQYITAVGGRPAIESVRSRVTTGELVTMLRREYHLHRPAVLASSYAKFGQVQRDSVAGRAILSPCRDHRGQRRRDAALRPRRRTAARMGRDHPRNGRDDATRRLSSRRSGDDSLSRHEEPAGIHMDRASD